jgi:hypothetical protein
MEGCRPRWRIERQTQATHVSSFGSPLSFLLTLAAKHAGERVVALVTSVLDGEQHMPERAWYRPAAGRQADVQRSGKRRRSGPRERMGGLEEVAEFVGDDVGIDLRRRNVGVAQQELHSAQVGAA